MVFIEEFKKHLLSNKNKKSRVTIKNYISDTGKFIKWIELDSGHKFNPVNISLETIGLYKSALAKNQASGKSVNRYLSSLRNFFKFLTEKNVINYNPFDQEIAVKELSHDPLMTNSFRLFLLSSHISKLTIKNYIMDIKQFMNWFQRVNQRLESHADMRIILGNIDSFIIDEYKNRLQFDAKLSPASINRKLSSLRKYFSWIGVTDIMINQPPKLSYKKNEPYTQDHIMISNNNGKNKNSANQNIIEDFSVNSKYPIPQSKQDGIINSFFFLLFIFPFVKIIEKIEYFLWIIHGKKIFLPLTNLTDLNISKSISRHNIKGIAKSTYAPLKISIKGFPRHKKILYHLKYTRPKWYRIYHTYPISNFIHLGILILCTSLLGSTVYNSVYGKNIEQGPVFASPATPPPKSLAFQGKLTDEKNNPITSETTMRFSIYNNQYASGSALLWQETQSVQPDSLGKFTASIGNNKQIPASIFNDNPSIYLGMTVGAGNELQPRQQIATTAYTTNSEKLQGMLPITKNGSGTNNVLLALNSAGNLTIGGNADPIFEASGGSFTITGKTLVLTTISGSNTNIEIEPDGFGIIDLQKPLQNTTNYNNIPSAMGAVEIDDLVAILATSSGQSALTIDQNSTGPIISASAGGIARFSLENNGTGVFAGNLIINGDALSSANTSFNLLNDNVINLNIAGTATSITIGAQSGSTKINNTLIANGGLTISPNRSLIVSGNIASNLNPFITGTYDLGSGTNHWRNAYIDNLYTNSTATVSGFWQRNNGVISPVGTTDDLAIGSSNDRNAKFRIYGTGNKAGTASTSGQLSFINNSQANLLNNANFSFYNSFAGDNGINSAKPALYIASNGFIGIGTNNPTSSLKVNGDIRGETFYAVNTTLQSADVAENYVSSQELEPGDIIMPEGKDNYQAIIKSLSPYDNRIIGVVSTKPGITLNADPATDTDHTRIFPIALSGRVPVKVTSENGSIQAGDYITSSSIPGVGMKATDKGIVIGKALENYSNSDNQKITSIMVFINLSFYDTTNPTGYNDWYNNQYNIDFVSSLIKQLNDLVATNIYVGYLQAQKTITDSLIVTTDNVLIGGQTLNEYITNIIEKTFRQQLVDFNNQPHQTLITNIISPLASESAFAIKIDDDKLSIINPRISTISALTSFDNEGNASLSGNLRADSINSNNATISGTLRVKNLIVDNIIGSSNSASYVTNITNVYNINHATNSALPISSSSAVPDQPASNPALLISPAPISSIEPSFTDSQKPESNQTLLELLALYPKLSINNEISSVSGSLSYNQAINASLNSGEAEFAVFSKGMMALGNSTFSDVSVAGNLSIGGSLILAKNTINTIGNTLQLQSLRQGNLSIMGNLVSIDTSGNLNVSGNAQFDKNLTVKNKLAVSLIVPVPASDLVIKLENGQNNSRDSINHDSEFIIRNSTNSAVLAVNQLGDIIASGSGTFSRIAANALNIVRGAQADTSLVQTIASSSAGTAVITSYETERTIISPFITKDSLIYLTATSDTRGLSPYVARQTEESFTIAIPYSINKDIKVNWWIIN